ncbi:MAG: hypothetical protein ASARMPREDX12_007213 [Alectoria sarmentosa]|nr:MAG: hypothetical protein ASARMPREDX12_007213 [Alectoria sarmentosa]
MVNNTVTFELAFGPADLASMSNTSINLELKFSNSILASMAHANLKQTFVLGHDPVQGFTIQLRCQLVPLNVNPHLPARAAPLQGPQESPVEQSTAPKPPRDSNLSTEAADNGLDQSDDEEWLNAIAATLKPIKRGSLQDPAADNDSEQSDDDGWLNTIAGTLEPMRQGSMPVPAPLVPGHPRARTTLEANLQRTLVPASKGRTEVTVEKSRLDKFDNPSSSAAHPVSTQMADIDSDETEEEDWKAMGVNALIQTAYANQPHTTPAHPYAPDDPKSSTQASKSRVQRASTGSRSGGRGEQKKRGRDVDTAPGRPVKAKKAKV